MQVLIDENWEMSNINQNKVEQAAEAWYTACMVGVLWWPNCYIVSGNVYKPSHQNKMCMCQRPHTILTFLKNLSHHIHIMCYYLTFMLRDGGDSSSL